MRSTASPTITDDEIDVVRGRCEALGVPFAVSDHHARGGAGAEELARTLVAHAESSQQPFRPLYTREDPVRDKIEAVARKMYGARERRLHQECARDLHEIERLGYAHLPVCIAKVPGSLSDDPKLRGRPRDFEITVRELQINAGAGFLVVLTGDIVRMPGLPHDPLARHIDLVDGRIVGLE